MADFEFFVDIEDSSGNKLGGGPLASVGRWRYTARFDRAGSIDFDYAANDPQASIVSNRKIARAHARLNDSWVEVGAGRIDHIDTSPGDDGRVSLNASGLDLIAELGDRTVSDLEIGAGSGATHSAALTAIGALAPAGWTFTPAGSPDNDFIYARYGGESVLGALVYLAERTETHFYRGTDRNLIFTSSFTDSGVRAIQAHGNLTTETCAIVSLRRAIDTHDLLTRITPFGSGQGAARLTLAASNRSAPSGYTLNAAENYIENDDATTAYGLVDHPEIEFKEITPISNTDADLQAAANMLFDSALEELRRRSTLADQQTFNLSVAGCSQLLRPMQTIRVIYRDVDQGIDIDEDLFILEATWEVDESGIRTSQLVVSTQDRWPESDSSAAAERAVQGRVFQAHPQMNANSYVTGYTKNVDENELAQFRFRFGSEVVSLQQVLFEFQLLPFESTVQSISGETVTTEAGGGSIESASSGGSHTHSVTVPAHSHTVTIAAHTHSVTIANHTHTTTIAAHSHTVTIAAHSHSTTIAAHSHTVTISGHSHTVTISGHSHTVTIAAHSHTVTTSDHSHTVTIPDHTHGVPNHQHVTIVAGSTGGEDLTIGTGGGLGFLSKASAGDVNVFTTPDSGATTSDDGGDTTQSSNERGGQSVSSTELSTTTPTSNITSQITPTSNTTSEITPTSSTLAQTTPTSSTLAQTTPTSSTLAQTTPTSSDGGADTVTSSQLAQTTPTSNVQAQSVETSSTNGNHTHTVTIPNHTHTLLPVIEAIYGIFRDTAANLHELGDLEYRINSGSWFDLSGATSAGDDWHQLDITSLVMNSTTFRPLQANNLLEVRSSMVVSTINDWNVDTGELTITTTNAHGLSANDTIIVSGAALGNDFDVDINGTHTIASIPLSQRIIINVGLVNDVGAGGGTVEPVKRTTIDAQLSVRNVIQAIAYV